MEEKENLEKKVNLLKLTNKKLWTFYINNFEKENFTTSRNSIIQLLIIPPLVNIFFMSKLCKIHYILKRYLSVACYLTFFIRTNTRLNQDFVNYAFLDKDLSNIIKEGYEIDVYNVK